jgi:hypothetical protein
MILRPYKKWWWSSNLCQKNITIKSIGFDDEIELISFIIQVNDSYTVAIIAPYRSHQLLTKANLITKLEDHVLKMDSKVDNIIIAGDLNINMFEINNELKEFSNSFGFTNLIEKGTRLCPQTLSYSSIDVMLTIDPLSVHASDVIRYPDSDHDMVIGTFNMNSSKTNTRIKAR